MLASPQTLWFLYFIIQCKINDVSGIGVVFAASASTMWYEEQLCHKDLELCTIYFLHAVCHANAAENKEGANKDFSVHQLLWQVKKKVDRMEIQLPSVSSLKSL